LAEEDFTNIKYDVDRQEGDLDALSKRIDKLQAVEVQLRNTLAVLPGALDEVRKEIEKYLDH
jgi:hypothetical protein